MFGDEANPHRSLLDIQYPITEGQVRNWDDFSKLWDYTFTQKLGLPQDKSDKFLLVTEAALNPRENREKMAETLFEQHNFGACLFETQALLSLMAEGLSTGLVFDSGDGVSHVIPVVDGFIIRHGIQRLNLAGRHITKYLVKLLTLRGYAFNSSADFETVREIKESTCFVSYDPVKDKKLANETTLLDMEYTLPDRTMIKIGRERFQAAECMFNPSLAGVEDAGYHQKIYDSVRVCEIDNFLPLIQNIMLTGGTTMFPGLSSRMHMELENLLTAEKYGGNSKLVKKTGMLIHDPPRRKHSVFIGASFLAKAAPIDQWISRQAWQENGSRILFN